MGGLPDVSICTLLALAPPIAVPHDPTVELPPHFEALELPGEVLFPAAMVFLPDGQLLIAEKSGRVRAHDGSTLQAAPVLDIADEVLSVGDRGLLSMALPSGFVPDGGATSWLYLGYTVSPVPGQDDPTGTDDLYGFSRIARYRIDTVGSDLIAVLASRDVLIGNQEPDGTVPDAIATLDAHACGAMHFGEDGSLLVATGDGSHDEVVDLGGLDDPAFDDFTHPVTGNPGPIPADQNCGAYRSQDLRSSCGKVLRLDPETGGGYPSNPFFDGDPFSNASRVWALGLRNPFRFALVPGTGSGDPALGDPGDLLLGDVGAAEWEEVNLARGGENFGWPCFEGPSASGEPFASHTFVPNPHGFPDCSDMGPGALTLPIVAWRQNDPNALVPSNVYTAPPGTGFTGFTGSCSMGGVVYEGGAYPSEFDGRYFFADFGHDWIRTLELDASGAPTLIEDFGMELHGLVDMAVHPITGDVHYLAIGSTLDWGNVVQLRWGENLSPNAVASATPQYGDPPLAVQFSSAGSSDPDEDPLEFEWDFDDGSPLSTEADPNHLFTALGTYDVSLTVRDGSGGESTASVQVGVGNTPPIGQILSPAPGQLFDPPETLTLDASVSDAEGPVTVQWVADLFHDTHTHPQLFLSDQLTDQFELTPHTLDGELYYARITLSVIDDEGLRHDSVLFVYPRGNVSDLAGRARFTSRVDELVPPIPLGFGNLDPEVARDGDFPPLGSANRQRQYDTEHGGDQGSDDWIGFELPYVPRDDARFVSLTFQEGIRSSLGGWWQDFDVEVRDDGAWSTVDNLRVDPPYAFEAAGDDFETHRLTFDPVYGDAIRLRGTPGGTTGYVSTGELRFEVMQSVDLESELEDFTDAGTTIASVTDLAATAPAGVGSFKFMTERNGTFPFAGATSPLGHASTLDPLHPPGPHWIGYSFDTPIVASRLVFQEGLHDASGGYFDTLDVEVRPPGGSWIPATSLASCPEYFPVDPIGFSYETFVFDFDPILVDGVRVIGTPGGAGDHVTVGELRVFGTTPGESCCGSSIYGVADGGSGQFTLRTTLPLQDTVPFFFDAAGAPGPGFGALYATLATTNVSTAYGNVLVNLPIVTTVDLLYDAEGRVTIGPLIPFGAIVGLPVHFQAIWIVPSPFELVMSNGVTVVTCP